MMRENFMLLNPVFLSVVILCALCLMKLNVLMSLILSALCGAMLAGIPVPQAIIKSRSMERK